MTDIDNIRDQLIMHFQPEHVLLFGSHAKGTAHENSDIDLCVVADTENKRRTLAEMYFTIEATAPVDFILYTPDEWRECLGDTGSFAYKINTEGVRLYG